MRIAILLAIFSARPRLRALAEKIAQRGGAGWRDPRAAEKLAGEVGEFWEAFRSGDRAEAATELADLVWYAAKLEVSRLPGAAGELARAARALKVTPRQAVGVCLAKYSYRASRERGKSAEHRARERALCGAVIGEQ